MKRAILFFSILLTIGLSANAQCIPDPQYTDPGVYPDSATGFDCAIVDSAYMQLITNVVPVDTTTTIGGFPITLTFDSAVVVSVVGLPPGFSYSCFDAQNTVSPLDQCCFEGGTTGCVSIVGIPQAGDVGTHQLSITVDVYLEGGSSPAATQVIDYYSIEVYATAAECIVGIPEHGNSQFSLYPNPVSNKLTIEGLEGAEISSISIVNTEGKVLQSFSGINSSSFEMNTDDFESGIYFVRIEHDSSINVVRFVKE